MKKILCALMCVMLLSGILCAAQAENITAYVTDNTLKVYQSASATANVLGTLKKNNIVHVVAVNGDWCRIMNDNGAVGYCMKKGLEKAWSGSAKGYVSADSLTVYATTSTSSKQLGTVKRGIVVTVTRVAGEWAQIKNNQGAVGYCKVSGLSKSNPNTCWIAYDGASIMREDKKTVAGIAYFGHSFTLVSVSGKWACVKNANGEIGYVEANRITMTNPIREKKTLYTQADGYVLFDYNTVKSVMRLPVNAELTLRGISKDNRFGIAEYRGKKYYVRESNLLNAQKVTGSITYEVTGNTASLWGSPSDSNNYIRNLKKGEKIRILECGFSRNMSYYKVQAQDGTVGYTNSWLWKRI